MSNLNRIEGGGIATIKYIYTYSLWIDEPMLRGRPEGPAACMFLRGLHGRGALELTESEFNRNREYLGRLGLRLAEIDRRIGEDGEREGVA